MDKLGPKNQNFQFRLKFGTWTNSNMQNSVVIFTFSIFDQKYHFRANLVQKINFVSLIWNFILRPIQVHRIQWWCSLFLFMTGNTVFGQIWSKKSKIVSLGWNLVPSLIWIFRTQSWCSFLPFSTRNTLFGQVWSKNWKLSA